MVISDKGHTQIKLHYIKNQKETAGQPLQTSSKLSNTNGTAIKQGKWMHGQKRKRSYQENQAERDMKKVT